jgi:hypothetical protein
MAFTFQRKCGASALLFFFHPSMPPSPDEISGLGDIRYFRLIQSTIFAVLERSAITSSASVFSNSFSGKVPVATAIADAP